MATIGLRDLYYAKIKEETEGTITYEGPKRLAKAISAEMTVETAEAILYADDSVDETIKEFISGEIKLNVNDIALEDAALLLGQKKDKDGVLYGGDADEPPYLAIGFRAKKPGGKFKYIWLYKVKFSIPDEKYQTKGDNIEFNTPEITGKFIKRPDGLWKADYVGEPTDAIASAWFTQVREKSAEQ